MGQLGVLGPGYRIAGCLADIGGIQSKQEVMKCLDDHLASYLEKVRGLEADSRRL